ncbi:hypothetical protein IWX90DRAFT_437769 [Phyllosticta citrichinensis]|uniref:Uncharacterized protein n=1 Tax=Phyllosticta citrichinensis TaxID=1130410 RepID=A0ABR1XMM7_9PEZI
MDGMGWEAASRLVLRCVSLPSASAFGCVDAYLAARAAGALAAVVGASLAVAGVHFDGLVWGWIC